MNPPTEYGNIPTAEQFVWAHMQRLTSPLVLVRVTSLALVLTAAGCGSVPPATYPTVAPEEDAVVALGTGDVLEVVIFNGSKENKATYRLDTSGTVSVQYIGEVRAVGRSSDELRAEIQTRLADGYLRDPIVSVTVTEVNSRKISVSGEVLKDGTIRFTPGMSIVDVIALSGGFTPMAKKNNVQVIRSVAGKEERYLIPVEAISEGKRPNFPMASGDRVFVPERAF